MRVSTTDRFRCHPCMSIPIIGFTTFMPEALTPSDALRYRFRYRVEEPGMGYVVEREGRWYAVGYEGLHPTTGADRRRWHRVADEALHVRSLRRCRTWHA